MYRMVLDDDAAAPGEVGSKRRSAARDPGVPDRGLLLGDGQRQGEGSRKEGASGEVGAALEGEGVGERERTGGLEPGREGGHRTGGAAMRGAVPEIEFVRGRTQWQVVAVPSWSDTVEQKEAGSADSDPQLCGASRRREYGSGAILWAKAKGCLQLAVGKDARLALPCRQTSQTAL